MASLFDTRRYLTNFDAARTGHLLTDILVVVSGVAGARAEALPEGRVRHARRAGAAMSGMRLEGNGPRAFMQDQAALACGRCGRRWATGTAISTGRASLRSRLTQVEIIR
jgi:hypothetical protein